MSGHPPKAEIIPIVNPAGNEGPLSRDKNENTGLKHWSGASLGAPLPWSDSPPVSPQGENLETKTQGAETSRCVLPSGGVSRPCPQCEGNLGSLVGRHRLCFLTWVS